MIVIERLDNQAVQRALGNRMEPLEMYDVSREIIRLVGG